MNQSEIKKNVPHIIGVAVLVLILLLTLTKFGYMNCDDVPGFCGIYYGIFGEPKVAIIHGEGAIGEPETLKTSFTEAESIFPRYLSIDNVQSAGVLNQFDVVIVEGPKNMSTQTLKLFASYVQKGGKLVWVGDAGTGLTKQDHICRQPKISYLPSSMTYNATGNTTVEQCGNWITLENGENGGLNHPKKLESGICGKSFGDIVTKFQEVNESIHQSVTEGAKKLCGKVDNPYQVRDAEGIKDCINAVKAQDKEVTEENVNRICTGGNNYWDRGPTLTESEKVLEGYDFGTHILGVDYIGEINTSEEILSLDPVNPNHALSSGYRAKADYYFGEAGFAKVDASEMKLRNEVIFSLSGKGGNPPAVLVSNPVGPSFQGKGNVVYFAFPPEIGFYEGSEGKGRGFIHNLIDFTVPH